MKRGVSERERGRPRRAPGGRSAIVKRVPMTLAEESRYKQLAERLGIETFAELVRRLLQRELQRVQALDDKGPSK